MNKNSADFFNPIEQTKYIVGENYHKIVHYLHALQAISKVCNLSYYIVDYYRKSFYYVSPNPLFLSGYTQEEVLKLGFDFYPLCVPNEDLEILFKLNEAGFDFFYKLPVNRREKATISYDFRLQHKANKSLIMINHKLAPLLLTDDGNIWMSICLVTLSSRKTSGDVHIIMQDDLSRYDLNDSKDSFENTQQKNLTKKEIEVLKCIAVGKKIKDIAKKLDISVSTVKNHKTNIFKKIGANTAAEAVFFAGKQNII